MEELGKNGFRPIAIDIPGFGKSPFISRRWSVRRAAVMIINQIIDVVQAPIILIGLSLGGVVAQKIVQFREEKIEKLVLISTFSHLHPKVKSNLPYLSHRILQVFSGNIRKQAKSVADKLFPLPEQKEWHDYLYLQIKRANPRIYRQAMIALAAFSSFRWMKDIQIPCLVISGSADSTVSLKDQRRLAKIIPGAKHLIIDQGGHAVTVDHYQQVNQELIRFLNEGNQ